MQILNFIKRTIALVICFLLFFSKSPLFGQSSNKKNNIKIRCVLPGNTVRDNQDLKAKIIITNISDSRIIVYTEFKEGIMFGDDIFGNNTTNLRLIFQRNKSNKYQSYSRRSHTDFPPAIDTIDHKTRITIEPKDSVINYFHVDSYYGFEVGNYRMKCIYWNDVHINKSIESNWIYFKVVKPIDVKHYFNEISGSDSTKGRL